MGFRHLNASRHLYWNHAHRSPRFHPVIPSKMSNSSNHLWTSIRCIWLGSHLPLFHLQCQLSECQCPSTPSLPNATTLNTGLNVIIGVAIVAVLFVRLFTCDELVGAITFLQIALLTVGAAGFTGTIAYYQNGYASGPTSLSPTQSS